MDRFLELLFNTTWHKPKTVLLTIAIPIIFFSLWGLTVPQDLSFLGVIDHNSPEIARYLKITEKLKMGGTLPILIEKTNPNQKNAVLSTAQLMLEKEINKVKGVNFVYAQLPIKWFNDNAPYLVEPIMFAQWLRLATEPENKKNMLSFAKSAQLLKQKSQSLEHDEEKLLIVQFAGDPLAQKFDDNIYHRIAKKVQKVEQELDVKLSMAGVVSISAQDQEMTIGRVKILTPFSLFLVLMVFSLIERRFLRLLAIALPMLLALSTTLGVVGFILGKITLLESFFGVMIFGLGIDFSLHLIVRLAEENAKGTPFKEAMYKTFIGTGRGVVFGGLTTAGAFALVAFAPEPAALHLGLSGAIGLTLCLIFMFTVLPILWIFFEKRSAEIKIKNNNTKKNNTYKQDPTLKIISKITYLSVKYARTTLTLAFFILLFLIAGFPKFHFETNLVNIFHRNVPAVKSMDEIQQKFGINGGPWFATVSSIEEARELSHKFEKTKLFSHIESLALFFPNDMLSRPEELRKNLQTIHSQILTYEGLLELSNEAETHQLTLVIAALKKLEHAATQVPPTIKTLPLSLKKRLISETGEFIVSGYPAKPTFDADEIKSVRELLQKINPEITGAAAVLEALVKPDRPWAPYLLCAIFLFVTFLLVIDLRSVKAVFLSLLPVSFGTLGTFGILCWLDTPFNTLTVIVIPLIIGLGVDDGIHVMHRIKEEKGHSPAFAAAQVGKAIVFTTTTTCLSFGTLLFTGHVGMETMAHVLLIGLPMCLLASITILPAASSLLLKD